MIRLLAVTAVLSAFLLSVSVVTADDPAKPAKKKNFDKRFQKIDANSDGKITKQEIEKFGEGKKNKKGQPAGARLIKVFERLDINKDGSVTLEEFKKITEIKGKKKKADK